MRAAATPWRRRHTLRAAATHCEAPPLSREQAPPLSASFCSRLERRFSQGAPRTGAATLRTLVLQAGAPLSSRRGAPKPRRGSPTPPLVLARLAEFVTNSAEYAFYLLRGAEPSPSIAKTRSKAETRDIESVRALCLCHGLYSVTACPGGARVNCVLHGLSLSSDTTRPPEAPPSPLTPHGWT
jgi:hypothetical protein